LPINSRSYIQAVLEILHGCEDCSSAMYKWTNVYNHLICWKIQKLGEDGVGERRNASKHCLNNVTLCMRSGALNVFWMQTDNYEHNEGDILVQH
jgi:hypothetical protein